MAKPIQNPTPPDRVDRWKKLWSSPVKLSDDETGDAFDEFSENFVPGHMQSRFLKVFGLPKMAFGNRFFKDDAIFRTWETRLGSQLPGEITHVEATVIYGSPDSLEAFRFRGEARRTLKDLFIDDWHAACAIVRGGGQNIYLFVEPKGKGAILFTERTAADPSML